MTIYLYTKHSIKQFISAQSYFSFLFNKWKQHHGQCELSTWHPTILMILNLCPERLILGICSGYHSNCRIKAMILCDKFVVERTLQDSIGSPGAAILQVFMVWFLDKGHLIGANFIQITDNYRASISIE